MAKAPIDIRSLARQHTSLAINTLAFIAGDDDEDAAPRVSAAVALLDRGWGKPPQTTSSESKAAIRVTIRHILEGEPVPRVIDHAFDPASAETVAIETGSDDESV